MMKVGCQIHRVFYELMFSVLVRMWKAWPGYVPLLAKVLYSQVL